jgi:hypothetical protein
MCSGVHVFAGETLLWYPRKKPMPRAKSPSAKPPKRGAPFKKPDEKKGQPLSLNFEKYAYGMIDRAAKGAGLGPGVYGRTRLTSVARYEVSGLSLDVAYAYALERMAEKNPALYASVMARLEKFKEPEPRGAKK